VVSETSQGCAFISGTVTSAAEVANLNRARMNTPPRVFSHRRSTQLHIHSAFGLHRLLVENAATRNIKMNPTCCQAQYFAFLHDSRPYTEFLFDFETMFFTKYDSSSYITFFRM